MKPIGSSASNWGRTTTSRNRSAPGRWWPGSSGTAAGVPQVPAVAVPPSTRASLPGTLTDFFHCTLYGQMIKLRNFEVSKQPDSTFEQPIGGLKSVFSRHPVSFHDYRVGDPPMGRNRPPRPKRAYLTGRIITDRKDEIHFGGPGASEFIPAFTAQSVDRHADGFQKIHRQGVYLPLRMAACAVSIEASLPQAI